MENCVKTENEELPILLPQTPEMIAKRKKHQLKLQILAVIMTIVITLGSGTVFAVVMFDETTAASQRMKTRLSASLTEDNYKCTLTCPHCNQKYYYHYVPDNLEYYKCEHCNISLKKSNTPKKDKSPTAFVKSVATQ